MLACHETTYNLVISDYNDLKAFKETLGMPFETEYL